MNKRPFDDTDMALMADKRPRMHEDGELGAGNPSISGSDKQLAIHQKRHSLKGPTMLLTGHDGEIFTAKFHPSGTSIASAGADRSIFMWSARGDCENYAILKAAHSHTILEVQFSADGDHLFSCSADKIVIIWDSLTGCRLKKLRNHQSYINSIATAPTDTKLLASVGDDCLVNVWDLRKRKSALTFKDNYQLTAVSFNKTNDQVMVGGIENTINIWDLRKGGKHASLVGHTDTITGLSLSPDGHHLLSNSMDNTLKCWDVRPSTTDNSRLEKTLLGHHHNFEKNLLRCAWSPNQRLISAGSSDGLVHIWGYNSCDTLYQLPGHRSSVNEVVFSPKEPLVLSCSSDKQIYLGEIDYNLL
uniref:U5 small nuclear ribonucleoprotein n=1 Tax=Aceria tosichella TaxID=561515 RepID=A0A6G1SI69_9ACAR